MEELTPIMEALAERDIDSFFEPAFGALDSALTAATRTKSRAPSHSNRQPSPPPESSSEEEEQQELPVIPAKRPVEDLAGRHEKN
jgi:hypothetical protein